MTSSRAPRRTPGRVVLISAWAELDPEVLGTRALTSTDGGPSRDSLRSIVPAVLGVTAASLDDGTFLERIGEAEVSKRIAARAVAIRDSVAWYRDLLSAHRDAVGAGSTPVSTRPERLLVHDAFVLATEHPGVDGVPRRDRARARIAERVGSATLTLPALDRCLAAPGVEHALLDELDRAWSAREDPHAPGYPRPTDAMLAALDDVLAGVGVGNRTTSASPAAESAWVRAASILDLDRPPLAPLDRLTGRRVARPGLTDAGARRRGSARAPLDRTLRERFERMLARPPGHGPVDYACGPSEAWTLAARASARPYGLGGRGQRLALLVAHRAALGLTVPDSVQAVPDLSRLPGGLGIFAAKWAHLPLLETLRRASGTSGQGEDHAVDPSGPYFSRLWTRLYRTSFLAGDVVGADEAWSHVYGALHTTTKDVPTVLRRVRRAPVSRSDRAAVPGSGPVGKRRSAEWTGATEEEVEAVRDVLLHVVSASGAAVVADFVRTCTLLGPIRSGEDYRVGRMRWNGFRADFLDGLDEEIRRRFAAETPGAVPDFGIAVTVVQALAAEEEER